MEVRGAMKRGMTGTTSQATVEALVELGVAWEFTGRRRDRLFVYDRYFAILGEGTEVAAGA